MSLENGKLSSFQLAILVMGFIAGSSITLPPGSDAGHDSWIAVGIGMVEGLIIAGVFTALATHFKGKTIVEINDLVYGRFLGKCISLLFIWYIFHLGALVLSDFGWFFQLQVFKHTQPVLIEFLIILICASTASRGIEVLARCSVVLVPVTILLTISDTLALLPKIDLKNLLPLLDIPTGKLLWAAHCASAFPFAETVAFLMILAFINKPSKNFSAVATGILGLGFILIMLATRTNAVLGNLASIYIYPNYEALQMIDIADILTRMEIIIAINLMTMGFIKISVLLYGTVLGLAQVLNLRSYQSIIIPISILMLILGLTNVENSLDMIAFAGKPYSIYALPFQLGIPLITLVIAKFRKLPKGDV